MTVFYDESFWRHMRQRLILFDIDGTLLKTDGAGRVSTRAAMLEVFGVAGAIDAHNFGGKTDWQTLTELLSDHGHTRESIGAIMARYEQAIAEHLTRIIVNHDCAPCPGAMETALALRTNPAYTLGIVTGNVSSTAPIKLRSAGYDPAWFPIGAYGSESMDRNDLPALALQRAMAYTGATLTAEETIVIGDTPADIECARALGGVAVAVCTGFSSRESLIAAQPDFLLDDLTSLHRALSLSGG
jgi:phosphoglycolate phosphatase-like HAD superfamily hydrolase